MAVIPSSQYFMNSFTSEAQTLPSAPVPYRTEPRKLAINDWFIMAKDGSCDGCPTLRVMGVLIVN